MKRNKLLNLLVILLLLSGKASQAQQHATSSNRFPADSATRMWKKDNVKTGLVHYQYEGYYQPFSSNQIVNVLDVDLNNAALKLSFVDTRPADSLSAVVLKIPQAEGAINGTYYEIEANKKLKGDSISSSFFKADNKIKTAVNIPPDHRLFWKHEGAFYYDAAKQKSGIIYGNSKVYNALSYANVVSGSPMLIFDYKPVGENFVKQRDKPLDSLDYEDPDRHQGVRHPRTAIARTADNHILLITVDGRAAKAAGMSAKELTQFIKTWFNPKDALNLDGGGSTTMWIKGSAVSTTGVVNYPTDDKKFDHYGQRKIRNSIIVVAEK